METLTSPVGLIVILAIVLFVTISSLVARYKRCPSDKILVIYGKTGGTSAKCIHGGGAFVWPVIQDFAYLDLRPLSIEANLTNALSRQNIRVDVPCRFTIAISTEAENMNAAAERLLGIFLSVSKCFTGFPYFLLFSHAYFGFVYRFGCCFLTKRFYIA